MNEASIVRTDRECRLALCDPALSTSGYTRVWRDLSGTETFTSLDGTTRRQLRAVLHKAFRPPAARQAICGTARAAMSSRLDSQHEPTGASGVLPLLLDAQAAATFRLLGIDPQAGAAAVRVFREARKHLGASEPRTPEALAWKAVTREAAQEAWDRCAASAGHGTLLGTARTTAHATLAAQHGGLLLGGFLDTLASTLPQDLPASCAARIATLPDDMQQALAQPGMLRIASIETLRLQPGKVAVRARRDDRGRLCLIALSEAGRDPAAFTDPDAFDPWRQGLDRSLSFGAGQHACPGKEFALSLAEGLLSALLACGTLRAEDDPGDPQRLVLIRRPGANCS